LWPEVYAQSHSDNGHVHATAPCSAHALAQARPTMSYIPLVLREYGLHTLSACHNYIAWLDIDCIK